jgi:uncharacterized membrane protein
MHSARSLHAGVVLRAATVAVASLAAGCEGSTDAPVRPNDVVYPAPDARVGWDVTPFEETAQTDASRVPDVDAHDALDAAVCVSDAPTLCPATAPRYADVAPIIRARCATCHSGAADGPWPLDSYGHIADWQNEIRSELLRCTMPPLDASVALLPEERLTILTWLRCGLPM